MNPQVIGVKEFIAILNETLTFAYPVVVVEGEVSSFKVNQGKWVFFDLKDQDATLGCFMPLSMLKVELEDGMKIRVTGSPRLTKWGKFSFTVRSIELAGEGALLRAYELLKSKLEAEGLFNPSRKRALPPIPRRIGLIASAQSAAYGDFIKILNARWQGVQVLLADVQVQGAASPQQVAAAFDYFNEMAQPPEVIVLVRGGGSLEDLQTFNTEAVCRAVAGSRTPTVVGVGHEVDTSLADLAADQRAATPTDAARLVVPDRSEMQARLNHLGASMENCLRHGMHRWDLILSRRFALLQAQISQPRERIDVLASRLRHQLHDVKGGLQLQSFKLGRLQERLAAAEANHRQRLQQRFISLRRVLASYDPQATLNRGYAIVRQGEAVLKDPALAKGELMIQLAKGKLKAKVDESR